MSLDFLIPEAASEDRVLARSPMERLAREAGAQFAPREGWNVALSHAEPTTELERLLDTVGFADRSSLAKLELQATPEVLAQIVAQASDGLVLEPGLAARSPGIWWCPVTPARVLVLGEPGAAAALRGTVAQAARDTSSSATVVDVTCGLAALSLLGPSAAELLARFCAIDVRPAVTPPTGFRPGSVARTPGYLLVEAENQLLLLVGWALGEYLWQVVADAAAHLGGGPVGAEALARHLEAANA